MPVIPTWVQQKAPPFFKCNQPCYLPSSRGSSERKLVFAGVKNQTRFFVSSAFLTSSCFTTMIINDHHRPSTTRRQQILPPSPVVIRRRHRGRTTEIALFCYVASRGSSKCSALARALCLGAPGRLHGGGFDGFVYFLQRKTGSFHLSVVFFLEDLCLCCFF